jgi:putative membrane protein
MLPPLLAKNDSQAKWLISIVSFVIFTAIVILSRVKIDVDPGFDIHVFALANACINSCVSILLVVGLIAIKKRRFVLHKKLMLSAMILSVAFLISYVSHHLLAGDTRFGDINHDNVVDASELLAVGNTRIIYFIILITHIFLAAIILPFILFTTYRAMIAEWPQHRKIAKITWPIWLYVSITGVVVYLMISPYY